MVTPTVVTPTPMPNTTVHNDFPFFTPPDISMAMQPADEEVDLVTASQYYTLVTCLAAVRVVVCVGGIAGNVINIRTFLRMGLQDSVTMAFFSLANTDLLLLLAVFAHGMAALCEFFEMAGYFFSLIDLFDLKRVFIHFERPFYFINTLTTMFLAIQRSLCVAIPLHFKGVFTRSRTFIILLLIWGYGLTCGFLIVLYHQPLTRVFEPALNTSILRIFERPGLRITLLFMRTANGLVLNFSSQIIVIMCLCTMVYVLKRSVKFRKMTSISGATTRQKGADVMNKTDTKYKGNETFSNSKERQAIVQVSIVSTIFLIASSPFLIRSIAQRLVPDLATKGIYHYTTFIFHDIEMTLEMVNSSVNIFVYYTYNTKFRQICLAKKAVK